MKNPTISVVIIAYNEEKYISKTLDSLMRQTVKPEEIIVVDNNSKDRTAEIARGYKGVRVVSETEQGRSPARNKGFKEAQGNILLKMDADTILKEDFIENLKRLFLKEKNIVGAVSNVSFSEYIWKILFSFNLKSCMTQIFLGYKTCPGAAFILTKEAWKKIKRNICNDDKRVHEDIELSLHLSNVGRVIYTKDCKAITSSRNVTKVAKEYVIRYLKQHWQDRGLLRRFRILWGNRSPYKK